MASVDLGGVSSYKRLYDVMITSGALVAVGILKVSGVHCTV